MSTYEIPFTVGIPLISKNGTRIGNAVVYSLSDDGLITVLTDFGNIISNMTIGEFHAEFTIPEWAVEMLVRGEAFPTIQERLEQQIEKLSEIHRELTEHAPLH